MLQSSVTYTEGMIRCPSICYSVYRAVNSGTIWYTYGKYKRPWKASWVLIREI